MPTQYLGEPRHNFTLYGLVVAAVLLAFVYFTIPSLKTFVDTNTTGRFFATQVHDETAVVQSSEVEKENEVGGKVYVSLTPVIDGQLGNIGVYSYEVSTAALEPVITEVDSDNLTPAYSGDGTKIAFTRIFADGIARVYFGDLGTTTFTKIELPKDVVVARNPVWSSDNATITFTTRKDSNGNALGLDDWSVYSYSIAKDESTLVSVGTNPMYLPDDSLLVLRADGLHRIAKDTGENTLVVPMLEGGAAANMKLDVSRDGKRLAWAVPDKETVVIFEVSSWAPFTATTEVLKVAAFWPTFSPDGAYLAMEAFDWGESAEGRTVTNYRLVFYALEAKQWVEKALDLSPYYQDALFITDWQ